MKKKILKYFGLTIFFAVVGTYFILTSGNLIGSTTLDEISTVSIAKATIITVDCSDNIGGDPVRTYRECEEGCPKKKGSWGPKNGTCTYDTKGQE